MRTFIPSERWPEIQAAIKGEAPIRRQPTNPVQSVRMVDIDDTDEDGN